MTDDRGGEARSRHYVQSYKMMPSIGARLRELRKRAGLTLPELAYMMGHRPGYRGYLSKLELGKLRFPTLALVADYLRACRASFSDLVPLLSEYTNRPPVRETPVREKVLAELKPLGGWEAVRLEVYDRKVGDSLISDARVRAARKQARAAGERRLLDRLMKDEVNRLGVKPTMLVRKAAHDYARMVWKAMRLTEGRRREGEESKGKGKGTSQGAEGGAANSEVKVEQAKGRRKTGRPRKTREQRLAEAKARIRRLAPRTLPVKALKQIQDKLVKLFEDVHRFEKTE
jgi:transcriptional regulator with XRE-family HTH domain